MRILKIAVEPAIKTERLKNYIKFILNSNPHGVEYQTLLDGILEKNPELKQNQVEAVLQDLISAGKVEEETK